MDNKEALDYWILEREHIRGRKLIGQPRPWSDDPIFQEVYFCNVRREDDKVTSWIRNWYELHHKHDYLAEFNMVLARFVNKPSSLEEMGWPFHVLTPVEKGAFEDVMSQKGAWGNAYIVSTNGNPVAKHTYILSLLERVFEHFIKQTGTNLPPTLAGAHRALKQLDGLGSFMAAQVVADLKNTPNHPLADAEDWNTWAAHGPGSLRGLTYFHEKPVTPKNFMEALASTRQWLYNNGRSKAIVQELCNQDLQNCMCEYSKYMKVKLGEGRSKRKYDGK